MKKLHRLRVDSLEPSTKYEGKWVCQLALDGEKDAKTFWMSHKQMTSLQKNMDRPLLYGAFDYDVPAGKGPRFIWAGSDKVWLEGAFINAPSKPRPEQPVVETPSFAETSATVSALKPKNIPPAREWTEEEIPF